jgi:DNA repair exonuclease SbcCD ATPase subunit
MVRRTSALPVLKDVFRYEIPAGEDQPPETSKGWEPLPPPIHEEEPAAGPSGINHTHDHTATTSLALAQSAEDLTAAWEKIAQLNDDLAAAIKERDEALNEGVMLREDMNLLNEKLQGQAEMSGLAEQLQQVLQERDEALNENNSLREEVRQAYELAQSREAAAAQSEELAQVMEERDRVRGDYVELREQLENLKQAQTRTKNELGADRAGLEKQLQSLQLILADREAELSAAQSGASGNDEELESLRQELSKKKDEASVAQRGLALSQKALQETREALREASEPGGLVSKSTMDNLKKENSTLIQQNMMLQAQHDQIARELSAAKAKLAGR